MAAAVIMTLLRARERRDDAEDADADLPTRFTSSNSNGADAIKRHAVSARELQRNWSHVYVRCDIMAQRLKLEEDMAQMVSKLPLFLFCLVCFMVAAITLAPADRVYEVHKHLRDHFRLLEINEVKNFAQLYDYALAFQARNEELQAASALYWCESRYMEFQWNDDLMAPQAVCKSPRLAALHVPGHTASWSTLRNKTSVTNGSNITAAHPRLLAGASTGSTASGGQAPPCVDQDEQLKLEESAPHATCKTLAWKVCDIELGILLCPKTCGYCSPFTYEHTHKYTLPQVTLLPAIMSQKRYVKVPCQKFAATYNAQPYNPALVSLPALDGERRGSLLTCVDRTRYSTEAFAMKKDCPAGSPESHCPNGKMPITEKHWFHDMAVYPEVLIEPARDIARMRVVEWLDFLTAEVKLSTMVYTADLEIFTSLSVIFQVDAAGNIHASLELSSYRDLDTNSQVIFVCFLLLCSLAGTIAVAMSIWNMRDEFQRWLENRILAFELFSRAVWMFYPGVLLITWCFQEHMSNEFDALLHTFLDAPQLDKASMGGILQQYLDVNTKIDAETAWLKSHKIVCYFIFYVQVLQLLFYFNAHPRMASLTKTIMKAADSILHFILLFGTLFCLLACIGHWILGAHIDGFSTFGATMSTQGRMIFGEFIYVDGVNELNGVDLFMYWLYAVTFMIVFFFTLLNFFLAIVVDAFNDTKQEVDTLVVERSFLIDLLEVPRTWILYLRFRWPSLKLMGDHFDSVCLARHEQRMAQELRRKGLANSLLASVDMERRISDFSGQATVCTASDIIDAFPTALTQRTLSLYLAHYYSICPDVLSAENPGGSAMPSEVPSSVAAETVDCEAARAVGCISHAEDKEYRLVEEWLPQLPTKSVSGVAASTNSRGQPPS